jgi:hypothetical protein
MKKFIKIVLFCILLSGGSMQTADANTTTYLLDKKMPDGATVNNVLESLYEYKHELENMIYIIDVYPDYGVWSPDLSISINVEDRSYKPSKMIRNFVTLWNLPEDKLIIRKTLVILLDMTKERIDSILEENNLKTIKP